MANETLEAFLLLGLENIPDDWVSQLWSDNFCESSPLSVEDHDALFNEANWQAVVSLATEWLDTNVEAEGCQLWAVLADGNITYKTIIAVIFSMVDKMKENSADTCLATLAANLYLLLLQIPGSGGFKVFHPMVFQRAIESLHLVPEYEKSVTRQKRKKTQEPAKKATAGGGGGKGKRKRQPVLDQDSMEVDVESSQSSTTRDMSLSEPEQSHINQLTLDAVKTLCLCLEKVSFRDEEVSRQQVITVLVKMIACDMGASTTLDVSAMIERSLRNERRLSPLGWRCLHALCQPFHGERERLIAEVFRQLLPVVSMCADDASRTSAVNVPPALMTVANHAVDFVGYIVKQGKEHAHQPIKALLQHVCFKTPDKAEYRTRLAKLTTSMLGHVEDDLLYISMLHWFYKFSRNTKVSFRLFALDIVSQLISSPLRVATDAEKLTGDQQYFLTYQFLLRIILSRCSDRSAVVRARALTALASAANSTQIMELNMVVKELVLPHHGEDNKPMETNAVATEDAGSHTDLMLPMIHRRASDDKVVVRKAAIQALEAIVRLDLNNIRKEDVQIFHDHCMDPALSIRKQALSSLNSLTIDAPTCTIMHSLWLDGVMPMVMDKETSVQEKCFSLLEEFLLTQITPHTSYPDEMEQFVWQLFDVIASDEDLQRYLKKACLYWTRQKKIAKTLVNHIVSHALSTDHRNSAWMILEIVATFTSALVDEVAVIEFWQQCVGQRDDMSVDAGVLRRVLVVLGHVTNKMSQDQLIKLQEQLEKLLLKFELEHTVAGAAIDTMEKIIRCQYPSNQAAATKQINKWAFPLIKCCENYLSNVVLEQPSDGSKWSENSLIKHLFILGEVAQLCPSHISHHLCLMIQSMLLATADHGSSNDSQKIQKISLPPQVIAHGYITLGKLCLQHVDLVEKSVVQMAMELEKCEHSVIRNNIIVVLCDLMVRYSSRVDMYVSRISACLKDESVLVRKQTLTLLTHLLQEDYVKWKDSLFFRFLSTLVDNELNRYAEFCLIHLISSKHPTVFYQNFVECLFFYNSYEKHKAYNRFKESAKVKELFSLKGSLHAKKRQELYLFMLKHMTDEQKFQLSGKLCQEVLGAIVDHKLPLDDDSFPLIRDALFVLASKEIKLTSFQGDTVEELEDEGDMMGAAVAAARNKLITHIVKKNVIENIVPIVVSIKHMFEKAHSPLLKDLMLYLKELMKDYRSDVADILASDKQLAEEIEFDLRRFEEEQQKAVAKGQTPAVITPHTRIVSPLLPSGALQTPPRQQPVAIAATPVATMHPSITPAAQAALAKFVTPKTKTPQQPLAPGSGNIKSVNQAVIAASVKRSAIKSSLAASRVKPRHVISKLNPADLPPPKDLTEEIRDAEDETVVMPASSGDRIASTPGGLAETISFNVSSIVPPSPIIASLMQKNEQRAAAAGGDRQKSKRPRSTSETSTQITINLDEPMHPRPWKVTFK